MIYLKKIKYIVLYFMLGIPIITSAQDFQNFGQLQILNDGAMGVFSDWANHSELSKNDGTIGFHGTENQSLYGDATLDLNDMEINNTIDLFLTINIYNNLNLIFGNINIDKSQTANTVVIKPLAFYTGSSNLSKVNGFCTVENTTEFLFPIGDNQELKALGIESEEANTKTTSAYFKNNPLENTDFNSLNLSKTQEGVKKVSNREYWVLESNIPSKVTLSWSKNSHLDDLSNKIDNITLLGWNILEQEWQSLKTENINGSIEEGFLKSKTFIPSLFLIVISSNSR